MKHFVFFLFAGLMLLSCTGSVSKGDIAKMNGYWEIDKVVLSSGKEKEYHANAMCDYFQIKDMKGFRKKATPLLNGTFVVNLDSEQLSIREINGKFMIHYTTFYATWDEELVSISEEALVLKNENGTAYYYKRVKPISILKYGKTTQ